MASFFTLLFLPFSMASTATYSLITQQSFPGRHASADGSLGGPCVPHLFPWDSWVGVSPVQAAGQPHACNLCVCSVVMVTQLGLVHGDRTVALKRPPGSCHRKLCCRRSFYGQGQQGAQAEFPPCSYGQTAAVVSQMPKVIQALVSHVAGQAHASRLTYGYSGISLVSFIPGVQSFDGSNTLSFLKTMACRQRGRTN